MSCSHPTRWHIGLMTGTVIDGEIDVALLKTNGVDIDSFGPSFPVPYTQATVDLLHQTLAEALGWQFNGPEPAIFATAEAALTREQTAAVRLLVDESDIALESVAGVGFHGQTVLHRPPVPGMAGRTRQLGDGGLMSRELGICVIDDLRQADIQAGGQGAPLSPIYHQALLRSLQATGNTAVLNLGGVANISWWDGADTLIGFDTGPANAPVNDWVRQHGLGEFDCDGQLAGEGQVDEQRLADILQHPYFSVPFPKSLDRFDFTCRLADGLNVQDGAALLTAVCAAAVDRALHLLPARPSRLVVCGGGRLNSTLLSMLRTYTGAEIHVAESVGWRGDSIEAECFAHLAARCIRGLPISFPMTTGVSLPQAGGVVHQPV